MNMEKEQLESLLIDYIDGKLSETERKRTEQELVSNPEVYALYEQLKEVVSVMDHAVSMEPSRSLKTDFGQLLEQEMGRARVKTVFFQPVFYQVAAAVAFLVVAVTGGYWVVQNQQQAQRLAEIEKEMEATKQMMMAMMNNDQSASQRITGVSVAYKFKKADDEIVNVLVKTMHEDLNTNVRMAALEALSKFHEDVNVRKELIHSLTVQKDPVVQIALIQLLVTIKEKSVMKDLERMTKDKTIMKAVKDEAYSGILKLS